MLGWRPFSLPRPAHFGAGSLEEELEFHDGTLQKARSQTNQSSADPAPDDEPAEVLADHFLDDFFDQLRCKLSEAFFDDDVNPAKEM